jgi:hypothetical protein
MNFNSGPKARHPFIFGSFQSYEQEIRAARGKPSSADLEASAQRWDFHAEISAGRIKELEVEIEVCREIINDEAQTAELRAEALQWAPIAEKQFSYYQDQLQQRQERAAEFRRYAEQARHFEARWAFNPYVDSLLDSLEQQLREAATKRPVRRQAARQTTARRQTARKNKP